MKTTTLFSYNSGSGSAISVEPLAKKVYSYLKTHCIGRANAITKPSLAQKIFNKDTITKSDLRLLRQITAYLGEQGLPIAFTTKKPAGVYILQNEAEKQDYLKIRRKYALAHLRIYNRAKKIILNDTWWWKAEQQKQKLLFV